VLIPLAPRGVRYRPTSAARLLRRNLLVDPNISPIYADLQVARVAGVTGLPEAQVRQLADALNGRVLGFLGEPGVNVTRLNLAIAAARGPVGGG
jgi:K+-transporting ATPase ATPase C chain